MKNSTAVVRFIGAYGEVSKESINYELNSSVEKSATLLSNTVGQDNWLGQVALCYSKDDYTLLRAYKKDAWTILKRDGSRVAMYDKPETRCGIEIKNEAMKIVNNSYSRYIELVVKTTNKPVGFITGKYLDRYSKDFTEQLKAHGIKELTIEEAAKIDGIAENPEIDKKEDLVSLGFLFDKVMPEIDKKESLELGVTGWDVKLPIVLNDDTLSEEELILLGKMDNKNISHCIWVCNTARSQPYMTCELTYARQYTIRYKRKEIGLAPNNNSKVSKKDLQILARIYMIRIQKGFDAVNINAMEEEDVAIALGLRTAWGYDPEDCYPQNELLFEMLRDALKY